jgi:hypothetical protein
VKLISLPHQTDARIAEIGCGKHAPSSTTDFAFHGKRYRSAYNGDNADLTSVESTPRQTAAAICSRANRSTHRPVRAPGNPAAITPLQIKGPGVGAGKLIIKSVVLQGETTFWPKLRRRSRTSRQCLDLTASQRAHPPSFMPNIMARGVRLTETVSAALGSGRTFRPSHQFGSATDSPGRRLARSGSTSSLPDLPPAGPPP